MVSAFDYNMASLQIAKNTAIRLKYDSKDCFLLGDMGEIPFASESFDWIFNIAVLHFAHNRTHIEQMLNVLWRVCAEQGKILIRLATNIGIEHLLQVDENQQSTIPDGSRRFALSEADLLYYTKK